MSRLDSRHQRKVKEILVGMECMHEYRHKKKRETKKPDILPAPLYAQLCLF